MRFTRLCVFRLRFQIPNRRLLLCHRIQIVEPKGNHPQQKHPRHGAIPELCFQIRFSLGSKGPSQEVSTYKSLSDSYCWHMLKTLDFSKGKMDYSSEWSTFIGRKDTSKTQAKHRSDITASRLHKNTSKGQILLQADSPE